MGDEPSALHKDDIRTVRAEALREYKDRKCDTCKREYIVDFQMGTLECECSRGVVEHLGRGRTHIRWLGKMSYDGDRTPEYHCTECDKNVKVLDPGRLVIGCGCGSVAVMTTEAPIPDGWRRK